MQFNIKNKLEKIDKDHLQLLIDIGDVASKNGVKAYLVGGMVRDLLLGYENLDIDITVENDSLKLADALVKTFPDSKLSAKHDRFHTAKVIFNMGGRLIPVDLASTREEIYKHPAALPEVRVSELQKDLIRRDFTINALAVSILPHDFGEVVDLFCGLDDLKNKRIRILHDKSFVDDPTRMIRAIRFAEKLNFKIEDKTLKLLNEAINSGQFDNLIEKIRGDRVKIELRYLFNLPNIENAVKTFFESGVYRMVSTLLKMPARLNFQVALKEKEIKLQRWLIALALIIKDLNNESKDKTMNNLQLTSDEIKIIKSGFVAFYRLQELQANNQNINPVIIYQTLNKQTLEGILIAKLLLISSAKGKPAYDRHILFLTSLIDEYIDKTSKIKLEITGDDLKKLGISEGKQIGQLLQKVLEKKIGNPNMEKDDEIKEVKNLIKEN